jgi:hypothetical protein
VSAFALHLALAGTGAAQASGLPAGTSLVIEGGAACPFGDQGTIGAEQTFYLPPFSVRTASNFGNGDCGWTGHIGLMQERQGAFLGLADYWGVFVRHTVPGSDRFASSASAAYFYYGYSKYYGVDVRGKFQEEWTVVDFEAGSDIGIGSATGKLRLFAGLRYARYTGKLDATSTFTIAAPFYGFAYSAAYSIFARHGFEGIGPRAGFTGTIPITGVVGFTFGGSASALWGRHKFTYQASGPFLGTFVSQSDWDWVFNVEAEAGLLFRLFQTSGATLTVGVRSEWWFDQVKLTGVNFNCGCLYAYTNTLQGGTLDRHNWGPFVRVKIPLGPPAASP